MRRINNERRESTSRAQEMECVHMDRMPSHAYEPCPWCVAVRSLAHRHRHPCPVHVTGSFCHQIQARSSEPFAWPVHTAAAQVCRHASLSAHTHTHKHTPSEEDLNACIQACKDKEQVDDFTLRPQSGRSVSVPSVSQVRLSGVATARCLPPLSSPLRSVTPPFLFSLPSARSLLHSTPLFPSPSCMQYSLFL